MSSQSIPDPTTMNTSPSLLPADIAAVVRSALAEDIGRGDLSAALVPAERIANATIISRESAVLSGRPWVEQVFCQLDASVVLRWHAQDGDPITANTPLCELQGPARALLTGERTALNFLQTLSATATVARRYASLLSDTNTVLLDTRKTLPGLRSAQKYAAACGGCGNHRLGLDDGILIKENHIAACGGIAAAVRSARRVAPALTRVEVEVETLQQVEQALQAGVQTLLLDNFSLADLRSAVALCAGKARTEASGNITLETLRAIAGTGVDFISSGAISKHIQAIDLSMRIE